MTEIFLNKQLKKGFVEYFVLKIIDKGEIYASEILEELESIGFPIVEGTLYPLLSRLRKEEIVSYRWAESKSGPPRKYYQLTVLGMEKLKNFENTWNEINSSFKLLEK